jgi:hypothetical protein
MYIALGIVAFITVFLIEEKAADYLREKGYKLSKPKQWGLALIAAGIIPVLIHYIRINS